MCFVIAAAVITLAYLVLSYIEFRSGLTTGNLRPLSDQFNGQPAWHSAMVPLSGDDHVAGGL